MRMMRAFGILVLFITLVPGLACHRGAEQGPSDGAPESAQARPQRRPGARPFPGAAPETRPPVRVVPVRRQPVDVRITSTATLYSDQNVIVYPEISEQIVRIFYDVGDWVEKDAVLIKLNDKAIRIQYEKARTLMERYERELKRQQRLLKADLVSQETFEQTQSQYQQAVLDYDTARINLERTEIRAPIAGQVVERFVTEGQRVTPSTQLLRIVNTRVLYGQIHLPERELVRIRRGQPVIVESDLFPNRTFRAVVDQITPVVDEQSGTFRTRFKILSGHESLRPGMFVRAHIIVDRRTDALVVPKAALVREGNRMFVHVVENGRAYRREIKVGYDSGDLIEVTAGLDEGDRVIIAGFVGLQEGQPVRVVAARRARGS